MTPRLSFPILLLAVACMGRGVLGEAPPRWQFRQGEELRFEVRHHTNMSVAAERAGEIGSETTQTVGLRWKVTETNEEFAKIDQTVESLAVKVEMPGGMELSFDSQAGKPAEGIAAMLSPMFDVLTGTPVHLQVTPQGELQELTIDDEAIAKIKTLPAIKALGELAAEEGPMQLSEAVLLPLPQQEQEEGGTAQRTIKVENRILGTLSGTVTWKSTGRVSREGKEYERYEPKVELDVTAVPPPADGERVPGPKPMVDPKLEGLTTKGEALFDREGGALHSSTLDIAFTLTGSLSGNPTTCKVEQKVEVSAR